MKEIGNIKTSKLLEKVFLVLQVPTINLYLSRMNPLPVLSLCVFNTHFSIIFPFVSVSKTISTLQDFPNKALRELLASRLHAVLPSILSTVMWLSQ